LGMNETLNDLPAELQNLLDCDVGHIRVGVIFDKVGFQHAH